LASITTTSSTRNSENGLGAGIVAYVLWGFLPLLFELLDGIPPPTVVADRTIWSLVLVAIVLAAVGRMAEARAVLGDPRQLAALALGAMLLASNWLIYVYAVETGQVLQASFGYFINPLVNVALGMAFLGERQNRWQLLAIAIAAAALVIQAVGIGDVPYIALGLAVTFAGYGFIRKQVKAGAAAGLFIETLVLSPVAIAYLGWTFVSRGSLGPHADPGKLGLLFLTGPATAAPLILFAYAVKRMRLTTIGMLQYIAPSIAFLLAITMFGEELNLTRLVSFGMIWLSLAVYTADSVVRSRRRG
jgi:chloramphenicol-sensitive protein RarD